MRSFKFPLILTAFAVLSTACNQKIEPPDNLIIPQSRLDRLMVQYPMFSGSIIVVLDGEITASVHAGFADRQSGMMNNAETLHSVASVGKMFTAVAIAQLVEAKLLAYDAFARMFELDLGSGELRKSGVKVRLQEQPFQVLKALVEHPSKVVSREELQQRLWRDETFVDFEDGPPDS